MKYLKLIFAISFVLLMNGCVDKDTYEMFAKPDWIVQHPEIYPNSFTAILCLPEVMNAHSNDDDLMSAFMNDECRGVGTLVKSSDGLKRCYFVTVRSSGSENGDIFFKYYNTRLSLLYQSKKAVAFETDGTYGNYDNPIELDLELVEPINECL